MVGMMTISSRERAADLINSSKFSPDIPSKLRHLRLLKELLLQREDPALLSEFVPRLIDLQTQPASPIRKFLAELIGEIGMKYLEYLPEMIPVLIAFLTDDTPAVARQAITTGTDLFRTVLQKIAIQGLFSSELGDSLESSWTWILKFKDAVCPIALLPGIDGVRLLAVKFVEVLILLYTPDPNDSLQLTPHQNDDGKTVGFNISWLRGGHPLLNVGDLAVEASQSLGLLLDLLRLPKVKSLSNSIIIVLINSLSAIAKKRPVFYGRVLPVLLSLDTSSSVMKGVQVSAANNSLKNAFLACLRCTHPGATPWRDRLVEALKAMDAGDLAAEAVCQVGISESTAHSTGETHPVKEDRLPLQAFDSGQFDPGRKRPVVQEVSDLVEDEDTSGKRSRLKLASEGPVKDPLQINSNLIGDTPTLTGFPASTGDGDSGPVHQLVAMFGALVAQGEKAAGSLEILISSISSDLLAEVVMANMRHLPPTCPKAEGEEEPILNLGSVLGLISSNSLATQSSFISGVMSLLSAFPQIESSLTTQPSVSHDVSKLDKRDEQTPVTTIDAAVACVGANEVTTAVTSAAVQIPCISPVLPVTEKGRASLPSDMSDVGTVESQIPGLDSTVHMDEMRETLDASYSSSTDMQGTYNEQVQSSGSTAPLDFPASGSMLPSRSEEHSPTVAAVDSSWTSSSTTTMVTLPGQLLLPKMSVPSMNLTDEQKDHLQEAAFVRIVEAYKQVKIAGGSHIRFSLLAYLGVEFPLELDTWGLLKKHILSDYMNLEGHELTLRVLYKLFGESEQDHDFFSSTTATSIYETFLLAVAETLRDSFPASDKSLSRLLGEVPYLPKAAFKMLECLCSPGSTEKSDKETQSGDRVTQGLSAVWSLILVRPSLRDACLKIALQSAVHHLEEVRMKAIRLVANKLYPMPCIAQKIEDFASEMLLSVANGCQAMEGMDAEDSTSTLRKDADSEKVAREGQSVTTRELSSDTHQSGSLQSVSSSSISEAQRCMSLYFALCTKKHFLLRQIFVIYKSIPKTVKQAVHRHIPILVRTIGSSSELLGIISDPPTGSESLLLQVLHTLTDGAAPSPELVVTVRRLYESKLKDVAILIPILSYLSKDEILPIFPRLVDLPLDKFKAALTRMLQGSSPSGATLTPAEVLIAIHGIDPDRDGIPLKKVTDACSACFEQRQVFTQQVLAKVLNQLVEQIPLPLLFMRTVIQAIGIFPALVDFTMEILSRLVNKQIWKYPKLWVGFLKCAQQTKPQSFSVLLQLPAAQLENALNRSPALKPSLTAHASQPNIRPSLPRSTLVVLGLAQEAQTTSQAQTSQSQIAGASTSGTDATTEATQESPAVS